MKKIFLVLAGIILAALAVLYFTGSLQGLTAALNVGQSPTADAPQCGYQWASQPLPEVTKKLQERLSRQDLPSVEVRAAAYGENCVLADGTIDHFSVRETDLYFNAAVADTADTRNLGVVTERIVQFVEKIPANTLIGPQEGYIRINFSSRSGGMLSLWFQVSAARAAMDQGLHGADLIAQLMNG
jgi:hypothetical protein